MAKTELTKEIERELYTYAKAHKLGIYGCFELSIGSEGYGNEYCDFMTMTSSNVFICYEIKISIADFNSAAKLSWYGNKNYYVLTPEVWEYAKSKKVGNLVNVGVMVYKDKGFTIVKRSPNKTVHLPTKVMLMQCMIRSLSRYVTKYKLEGDKK